MSNQKSFFKSRDVAKPIMIRELPESERPTSRLQSFGVGALSTAEIVAAILQTPQALYHAHYLLANFDGLLGLCRASLQELQKVDGIGPAQAARLKAALEIGRRASVASPEKRLQIKSPADTANLLMSKMGPLEQEHMVVVLLNNKNYVINVATVYIGSLTASMIRVGELFREAIRQNAAGIIVAHNHPSGDPTPSSEDVAITEHIVQAGELMNINVFDHIIVGRQRYVSLKKRGLGFE